MPPYFDNNMFEPRFRWRMRLPDINGAWNPRGTNSLRFTDIRVTSVCDADGRVVSSRSEDAAAQGRVAEDELRPAGKLVDLDPEYQFIPEIWGLRLCLLNADGTVLMRGDYRPVAMVDLWLKTTRASGRSDPAACFQSVLTGVEWLNVDSSPVLRALRDTTHDGMLSIKLNMDSVEDGMDFVDQPPDNTTFGRLTGAIGPYARHEPKHFLAGRRLRKADGESPLNHAPCRIDADSRTVFVDLGNSVPAVISGGPPVDLGPLRLAVLRPDGDPEPLGPLDGAALESFEALAGIATVRLTRRQLAQTVGMPLAIVNSAGRTLLAEGEDGLIAGADGFVFRMFPGQEAATASTTISVTRFGVPADGVEVYVGGGASTPELAIPTLVRTDSAGRAEVTITARAPDSPRRHLDGVLFNLPYGLSTHPGAPEGLLSVRIFERYSAPERPTWVRDVQPLFQQYANLYPVMRDILDLGNYRHVLRHRTYIRRTLLAPMDSPNHMPVSRDLSPGKRDMIVKWLDTKPTPPILEIATVQDLRDALQQALLVEHATIPPYLCALLSIRPDHNIEIAELIRGVVLEEMQHMVQVANLLNAVGGTPSIGRPGQVPTYPGKLPGPVMPDLTVTLRRMSMQQVKDVFMAIEQPEHPVVNGKVFRGAVIRPESVALDSSGRVRSADEKAIQTLTEWFDSAEYTPMTIGWFYNQIARAIIRLDRDRQLFTGDVSRQVSWPDAPGTLYQVTDRRSALLAVYQIIEQGEGSPHDLDGDRLADPGELGHYYRFEEIVRGRRLIRTAEGAWKFEGPAIPFDPTGVHPMVDDPDTFRLPAGSLARRESELCDKHYTGMLAALSRVVSGYPGEMDNAVGLMYQMQAQARKLYDIPSVEGASTVLGPAFQSPGISL